MPLSAVGGWVAEGMGLQLFLVVPLVGEEGVGGWGQDRAVLDFNLWELPGVNEICFLAELLMDLLDFVEYH